MVFRRSREIHLPFLNRVRYVDCAFRITLLFLVTVFQVVLKLLGTAFGERARLPEEERGENPVETDVGSSGNVFVGFPLCVGDGKFRGCRI